MNWTNAMEGGRLIDTERPWMRFDPEAVWQDRNGDTCLGIKTSPRPVRHWDGTTYDTRYAVGVMRSVETYGYGTFSADIRLPKGRNLWPSFWLVGDGHWPDNGEIDIMEAYSDNRGSYFKALLPRWNTSNNVHYADNGHKQIGASCVSWLKQTHNPTDNFVNYAVEWRPNKVTFKVNGKTVREVGWEVTQHFAGAQMHVIFNVWTASEDFTLDSPMMIRNFKYDEL